MTSLRLLTILLLTAWGLTLGGCARLMGLKQDLAHYDATVVELSGELRSPGCADCLTVLVAQDADGQALSYKVFERPGVFHILASTRVRSVFAFHDRNHNLSADDGEACAWQPLPGSASASAPAPTGASHAQLSGLQLALQACTAPGTAHASGAERRPRGSLFALRDRISGDLPMQLGRVVQLQDAQFGPEMADLGMWQPAAFMQRGLAGIYFLEPYDPRRIPVLLVHGIDGSPRDFAPLVERLDRRRFQPWLVYYPSGLEIPTLAHGILGMLNKLWFQHGFTQLHVLAHSMGGLVSRELLNTCREERECDFVRSFVSISSPFGGVPFARSGRDHAPVVMPVWRSLSPDSAFIGQLFAQPLPAGIPHHLMFGYRNHALVAGASGDGTIALDSQLSPVAQQQAQTVFGYDEDHMSILANADVAQRVNRLLAAASR